MKEETKKECYLYEKISDSKVRCNACFHRCIILNQGRGICGVRENIDGILYSLVYENIVSLNIDPIEKKPLYHFYPGKNVLSFGTVGCNFSCLFCQNSDISFAGQNKKIFGENIKISEIVDVAKEDNSCVGIAYTYTEPTIFIEMVKDCSKLAKSKGLKNILVTNGYMTKETLDFLEEDIDAMNIDLKSFSDEFYKKNCKARLKPVLDTIKYAYSKGIWIEITTLIIPKENDSEKELKNIAEFIASVDKNIPWHISRFIPMHNMKDIPITSKETLDKAERIGKSVGLNFIYKGNVSDNIETICPKCNNLLIRRNLYNAEIIGIKDNKCKKCKTNIGGEFYER